MYKVNLVEGEEEDLPREGGYRVEPGDRHRLTQLLGGGRQVVPCRLFASVSNLPEQF